ncbi:hypothetical protein [Streptomyces sp. NPDC016845]|uniref:hypothetical protein n=1 Tax=Streptomyces sp. NPDC016845 TaxID=3364972 RepID=UPI00379F9155
MICWRCHKAITPGQAFESYAKVSISAAGATIHMHKRCPVLGYYLGTLLRRRSR